MTNEQINTAIAEACGWSQVGHNGHQPVWANSKGWVNFYYMPDYANDLNAMHAAEKELICEKRECFRDSLEKACAGTHQLDCISATAHQRAEAVLRTIGKWEEARK